MISLNAYTFYEGWGKQLKDSTKITAPDYTDYSSPGLAYG